MGAHKNGSIHQGIVFVCVKVSEPSIFYFLQKKPKARFTFAASFKLLKKWSSFSFTIVSLRVSTAYLNTLCLSFQVRNPLGNVDKNAILPSSCDPQHLPLCVPHPHLLFLIRSPIRFGCFYVDLKRKILETLENKVYIWSWHQVLRRCAS